jgi:hypothetical protein
VSAIASFHILPRGELQRLLDSAITKRHEVKRWLPFLAPRVVETRGFAAFLTTHATTLEHFPFSGYVLTTLDMLLEPHDAELFGPLGLVAESEQLSASLGVTSALFDYGSAQQLTKRLLSVELTKEEIVSLLESEYGSVEERMVEAVRAALEQSRRWLAQVPEDGLGLLSIG